MCSNYSFVTSYRSCPFEPSKTDGTIGFPVKFCIGASAGIFACDQPFGVGKQKTAEKRGKRGEAAMLFSLLEKGEKLASEKEGSHFLRNNNKNSDSDTP